MVYFGDHDDFHQTVIDTERDQANSHVDFGSVSCGQLDISTVKIIKRREVLLITNVINSNNSNGNDLQKSDKKIALI